MKRSEERSDSLSRCVVHSDMRCGQCSLTSFDGIVDTVVDGAHIFPDEMHVIAESLHGILDLVEKFVDGVEVDLASHVDLTAQE